jgi:protein PhnA
LWKLRCKFTVQFLFMTTTLANRANNTCEICSVSHDNLTAYTVPPKLGDDDADAVVLCTTCNDMIIKKDYSNANHFRGLVGSIWSEVPAVQVLSYKLLAKLQANDWAAEALDGAYLDETLLAWAYAEDEAIANEVIHKDAYGVVLQAGDTVLLTENLNVKGTNFIAPKGTKVPKIRLVPDNADQIEGKVNGDTIVILTKFVRKSS